MGCVPSIEDRDGLALSGDMNPGDKRRKDATDGSILYSRLGLFTGSSPIGVCGGFSGGGAGGSAGCVGGGGL